MNRTSRSRIGQSALAVALAAIVLLGTLPALAAPFEQSPALAVPTIAQRFSSPEWTGQTWDSGLSDCLPASVAMVLQSLRNAGRVTQGTTDYPAVRRAFRQAAPNARQGIHPEVALQLTPRLTDNAVRPSIAQTQDERWQAFLLEQLTDGYPVIALINDWNLLAGRWAPANVAHAIVVSALKDGQVHYNDPWDGKSYTMPSAEFQKAWGNARPPFSPWLAVAFRPGQPLPLGGSLVGQTGVTGQAGTTAASAAVPGSPQARVAESLAAMRALPIVDVQAQISLVGMDGSGHLLLRRPSGIEGQGDLGGATWSATTNQGRTTVRVNDGTVAELPAETAVEVIRDGILSIPSQAKDWEALSGSGDSQLEGELTPEAVQALRKAIGVPLPGTPSGRLVLTLDPRTRIWKELELKLSWPVAQVSLLGRDLGFGPSGSASLVFSTTVAPAIPGEAKLSGGASARGAADKPIIKSSASAVVNRMDNAWMLRPLTASVGAVFDALDFRQVLMMPSEEAKQRAKVELARRQFGEKSPEYATALRGYRDWTYRIPLAGLVLRLVKPSGE